MADSLKVELITRDFGRMLEELAAIDPRIEFSELVTAIAARVVFNALYRTSAAKASAIKRTWQDREYTTFGGKRYKLSNHYPDRLWGQLEQFRDDRLAVKLAARGLAKKSWLHLARDLGSAIPARVPGYVQTANYKGRDHPENAAHSTAGSGTAYSLKIINSSTIVQLAGGQSALLAAMQGEIGYFRQNMAHQFYLSAASRAKKYPGVFLSPTLAAA